jgi:hypothetical protein
MLKISKEWEKLIPKEVQLEILDPDGWDRTNYDYSFNKEKITFEEFLKRLWISTVSCDYPKLEEWIGKQDEKI